LINEVFSCAILESKLTLSNLRLAAENEANKKQIEPLGGQWALTE